MLVLWEERWSLSIAHVEFAHRHPMQHIQRQLSMYWCNSYTHVRRDANETNADIRSTSQQVSIGGIHMLVCRTVTSMGLECLCSYTRRGRRSVSTTRMSSYLLAPTLLHSVLAWTVGTSASQIHHDVNWNRTSETTFHVCDLELELQLAGREEVVFAPQSGLATKKGRFSS